MEYARLGSTGLKVSSYCMGMDNFGDPSLRKWAADIEAGRPLVQRAVEQGINFFDTADAYSLGASEVLTGKLLRECFAHREEYVIATKVFNPMGDGPNDRGLSRSHILASVDASLSRLETDHIDLYYLHRWDTETPIAETMRALEDLVRAGKVRYLGASSMWAWQFSKAQHTADLNGWTRFVAMENHYNLLYREEEREMLPLLVDQGVSSVPYSPLARGLLARAGTVQREPTLREKTDGLIPERYPTVNDEVLAALAAIASGRGEAPAKVALAWLRQQPAVTSPIIGATKLSHIDDAIAALDIQLSDEERAALEQPYRPQVVSGHI